MTQKLEFRARIYQSWVVQGISAKEETHEFHCGNLTLGAQNRGREFASCPQQLAAYLLPKSSTVFSKKCHNISILIQHCVLVLLFKTKDHCSPAVFRELIAYFCISQISALLFCYTFTPGAIKKVSIWETHDLASKYKYKMSEPQEWSMWSFLLLTVEEKDVHKELSNFSWSMTKSGCKKVLLSLMRVRKGCGWLQIVLCL